LRQEDETMATRVTGTHHNCGGQIQTGEGAGGRCFRYCEDCKAFTWDMDSELPPGTDMAKNIAAFSRGDHESPDGE
jgi:hypothetical protein